MADVNRKEGVLTPDDLAVYGIPPKPQPSSDSNSYVADEMEKNAGKVQSQAGVAEAHCP